VFVGAPGQKELLASPPTEDGAAAAANEVKALVNVFTAFEQLERAQAGGRAPN
jgi:hypothetical protein